MMSLPRRHKIVMLVFAAHTSTLREWSGVLVVVVLLAFAVLAFHSHGIAKFIERDLCVLQILLLFLVVIVVVQLVVSTGPLFLFLLRLCIVLVVRVNVGEIVVVKVTVHACQSSGLEFVQMFGLLLGNLFGGHFAIEFIRLL